MPGTDRPPVTPAQVNQLWSAVVARGEHAAVAVAMDALDAGTAGQDVLLDLVAPVQDRVGREWAANRLTVAGEHAATAINDRVIAAVALRQAAFAAPSRGRVTVACVDGEWHALPARLLAEVLRMHGFTVDYLGGNAPRPQLIAHVHQTAPEAVALSASLFTRLPAAHAAITACQDAGAAVLAGGAAFGTDGGYATLLGANAWAPDARAAVRLLNTGLPRPATAPGRHPGDVLPHLADQEYALLTDAAPRLVGQTVAALRERWPATSPHPPEEPEDIAHLIDFLATAVYLDDQDLLTRFLHWTTDIRTARGFPACTLTATTQALADQLIDFPRATRILTGATAALTP